MTDWTTLEAAISTLRTLAEDVSGTYHDDMGEAEVKRLLQLAHDLQVVVLQYGVDE